MDIHSKNCWFFDQNSCIPSLAGKKIKNFVLAAMSRGYAELERCIPSLEMCPCNKFMLCSDKVGDLLLAPFIVTCNWCIHKLLWSILLWIMAIIITRTAAVILHHGFTTLSRSATWNLTANRSEEQKCFFIASWTISDNYLKTMIRSLLPLSHLWRRYNILSAFCQVCGFWKSNYTDYLIYLIKDVVKYGNQHQTLRACTPVRTARLGSNFQRLQKALCLSPPHWIPGLERHISLMLYEGKKSISYNMKLRSSAVGFTNVY